MKRKLKLDFVDFYDVNKNDNHFTRILSKYFDIEINSRPDIVIFSGSGHVHKLYTCKKVFYTNESLDPNWNEADYAITYHYSDKKNQLRLPYYAWGTPGSWQDLIKSDSEIDQLLSAKRKFCSAVISNSNPRRTKERLDFFNTLHETEFVASGGGYKNNVGEIGKSLQDKINFIKNYKFNIAYENKLLPGYVTEKLTDAMLARCIPLYWGCERVGEEFNKKSFLCRNDFLSQEAFVDYIMEVHHDDSLYESIIKEPYFINNQPNIYYDQNRIINFFEKILDDNQPPISRKKSLFSFGRWKLAKRDHFY
jgi:alpha(1,3/1,4) fucosyltransferase